MESVLCDGHSKPCMLKTGVKPGANYGKSFYICSRQADRCTFVKEARGNHLTDCSVHRGHPIELQTFSISHTTKEKRLFSRCMLARGEKKNWCGYKVLETDVKPKISPLADHNHKSTLHQGQVKGKQESAPIKEFNREKTAVKPVMGIVKTKVEEPSNDDNIKTKILPTAVTEVKSIETNKPTLIAAKGGNDSMSEWRPRQEIQDDSEDEDCLIVGQEPSKTSILAKNSHLDQGARPKTSAVVKISPSEAIPKKALPPQIVKMPGSTNGAGQTQVITTSQQQQQQQKLQTNNSSSAEHSSSVPVYNKEGKVIGRKLLPPSNSASKDLVRNITLKADLIRQLESQKILQRSVNKSLLPDGGAKIKSKVDDLTAQISQLDIKIQEDKKIAAQQQQQNHGGVGQPQMAVKTTSGQVLSGVRQTKITDHVTNLPPYLLNQMYAANPQMMTLYGGRMTESRLREVGNITTEALEKLHKQLANCPSPTTEEEDPKGLKVPLMTHQRQAIAWLLWREKQEPRGGILADDMGLGKTLTMISLIMKEKQMKKHDKETDTEKAEWLSKKVGPGLVKSAATLVVCPASLVHQWDKEIKKRCKAGRLSVTLYHGPNREPDIHKLAESDVVLTTYNLISREVGVPEEMKNNKNVQDMPVDDKEPESTEDAGSQPNLLRVAWQRIILDEAHNIKNHKSLTAMSVCRLRAGKRWALSGTPIQNDLLDMYSLLRFLRCSPFDEYKLWKRQVDNKSEKGKQRLNTLVKSLLLRRTKDQTDTEGKPLVALPSKTMVIDELALSKEEKLVYEKIFQQSRSTMQAYIARHEEKALEKELSTGQKNSVLQDNNPWAKHDTLPNSSLQTRPGFVPASQVAAKPGSNGKPGGASILLCLLRLRQCCGHLSLMKDAPDMDALETDGLELDLVEQMMGMALTEQAEAKDPDMPTKGADIFDVQCSSTKVKTLMKKILEVRSQSPAGKPMKSVVVSQWTKMLDVVEYHLKKEGFKCCTIRGNILPKHRSDIVETFNNDPKGPEVMLLSLRAGGVGLNLVGGNHLFLMDMHWNPALEAQAFDRVYRVGQTKDVHIHKFVCKDTVEEKIMQLQKAKTTLASNVLSGSGASANKLTLADLKMLFGLDQPRPTHVSGYQGAGDRYQSGYQPIQPARPVAHHNQYQ